MESHNKIIQIKKTMYSFEEVRPYLSFNPMVVFLCNEKPGRGEDSANNSIYFVMDDDSEVKRDAPLMLGFKNGHCGKFDNGPSKEAHFLKTPVLDDSLSNLFAIYILQELESCGFNDVSHLENMIIAFGNYLLKKFGHYSKSLEQNRISLSPFKMKKIEQFVNENIDKTITTTHLAQIAGLSVYHFTRKFKKATTLTPHQYVNRLKMERAKDLLISTEEPIIQVGFETGFNNPSHFSQIFKNFFGITPLSFRKRLSFDQEPKLVGDFL